MPLLVFVSGVTECQCVTKTVVSSFFLSSSCWYYVPQDRDPWPAKFSLWLFFFLITVHQWTPKLSETFPMQLLTNNIKFSTTRPTVMSVTPSHFLLSSFYVMLILSLFLFTYGRLCSWWKDANFLPTRVSFERRQNTSTLCLGELLCLNWCQHCWVPFGSSCKSLGWRTGARDCYSRLSCSCIFPYPSIHIHR